MFRTSTTIIELPEFVRDSIPNVPVEKKDFGSSVTDNVYAYTGLEGWPHDLYWKPSERVEGGIVFLVSDDKEVVVGRAQSPFSPMHDIEKEITNYKYEKNCEEILTPYLSEYCKLLSALFREEKLNRDRMIYDFILDVITKIDRDDLKLLQATGESARKSILSVLKRLFQKKHNEMLK